MPSKIIGSSQIIAIAAGLIGLAALPLAGATNNAPRPAAAHNPRSETNSPGAGSPFGELLALNEVGPTELDFTPVSFTREASPATSPRAARLNRRDAGVLGLGAAPWLPSRSQTPDNEFGWRILPSDTLFRSFIAGVHAPRMAGTAVHDSQLGTLLDVTLGGRISLVRYGTFTPHAPQRSQGVELQVYGGAFTRLATDFNSDVFATDFKFGVPLVFRFGSTAWQIGYDHLSSHVGDEYLERYPNFQRRNYVRDSIRFAIIQDLNKYFSVYSDVICALHHTGGAGVWHFQFGAEFEPPVPPGIHGAPVAAINTKIRQEFNYNGSVRVIAGWQWRGYGNDNLLRLGLKAYTGPSRQYAFYDRHETLIGAGLWYDF